MPASQRIMDATQPGRVARCLIRKQDSSYAQSSRVLRWWYERYPVSPKLFVQRHVHWTMSKPSKLRRCSADNVIIDAGSFGNSASHEVMTIAARIAWHLYVAPAAPLLSRLLPCPSPPPS